jgi:plastocyanin
MKRLFLLPLAGLAAVLVVAAAGAATQTVQITKNGFTPQSLTLSVGDTVTWHNADTADHQVVGNDGSFASPVLQPDQTYSHTFSSAGTFRYHDAFARTHVGTITVNGPPASLTLSSASRTVVYGGDTTLSGTVSSQAANEPVTLTAQATGKGTQSIDSTQTSSNGSFSFSVSPTIGTTYQAHWRSADSSPVSVQVAPRVGFGLTGRLYIARVTSDLSYAGHYVWLQRHFGFGWRSIKRVYLGANSRAVFTVRTPRGHTMLRLFMPAGQAGAGYVAGLSRTIVVFHR